MNRVLDADGIFTFTAKLNGVLLDVQLIYRSDKFNRQFNVSDIIKSKRLINKYNKKMDCFLDIISVNLAKNLICSNETDIIKALQSA